MHARDDGVYAGPGTNFRPQLNVDAIDVAYRFHWDFATGPDPTAEGVRVVEVFSNTFRLTKAAANR